ncbi:methylamine utilization protein [Ferrimonas marina]|nr:methylamine utilization protein [Ferrimonas marina]
MSAQTAMIAIFCLVVSTGAQAERFGIKVLTSKGEPIEHAVAALIPKDSTTIPPLIPSEPAVLDQIDRQFKPYVLAIQAGQRVSFPNSDSIKHHVYSFSDPKTFELRLYKDKIPEPLEFETPGIVALGCNIHDWMIGYIYVAESPWFGISAADGEIGIDLPAGEYRLKVWHPLMQEIDLQREQDVTIGAALQQEWMLKAPLHSPNFGGLADEFDDY